MCKYVISYCRSCDSEPNVFRELCSTGRRTDQVCKHYTQESRDASRCRFCRDREFHTGTGE